MPDWNDVTNYEKDATDALYKLNAESPSDYPVRVGILAVNAIVCAILALGVRIDYAISTINRP